MIYLSGLFFHIFWFVRGKSHDHGDSLTESIADSQFRKTELLFSTLAAFPQISHILFCNRLYVHRENPAQTTWTFQKLDLLKNVKMFCSRPPQRRAVDTQLEAADIRPHFYPLDSEEQPPASTMFNNVQQYLTMFNNLWSTISCNV